MSTSATCRPHEEGVSPPDSRGSSVEGRGRLDIEKRNTTDSSQGNWEQARSKGARRAGTAERSDEREDRPCEGIVQVNAREGIVHVNAREGIVRVKMTSVLLPVLLLLSLLNPGEAQTAASIIPQGYDKSRPPSKPVNVEIGVYKSQVTDIDAANQKATVEVTLRAYWDDPRLKNSGSDFRTSDEETIARIWQPDLFFVAALATSVHRYPSNNELLLVQSNGTVLLSRRFTVVVTCKEVFAAFYPMDGFNCSIVTETFASTAETVRLTARGISYNKDGVKNQEFYVPRAEMTTQEISISTGTYSSVLVSFILARNPHRYIAATFVPLYMAVFVSYLTFWMNKTSMTVRLLLNGMMLIAIFVTAQNAQNVMHKTTVSTAMDWKIWMSFAFVLACLLEGIALEILEGKGLCRELSGNTEWATGRKGGDTVPLVHFTSSPPGVDWKPPSESPHPPNQEDGSDGASRIDEVFRIAYPVLYLLFLVVFWIACLA
ncbi:unnamed protein product [Darwinula stevensoni]|uniref:Neurotransmitter-gated ion-channel ligand-binding domain-containing protein n=1 Tax=Darwinula stevensoni TaxID=69355 RepID=A0A7R9A0A1_9CRUS|nr:unnamed protein product [Darwinula stevensoni]CAG0880602.1 unnamed protein product [Darwinula stevensoni]